MLKQDYIFYLKCVGTLSVFYLCVSVHAFLRTAAQFAFLAEL